jgi:hypothetical protein
MGTEIAAPQAIKRGLIIRQLFYSGFAEGEWIDLQIGRDVLGQLNGSSVSRAAMSFWAAGLKTMLNFFCATMGFQFCDEGVGRQTAGERVFGIGILDPASEKGIVFNKIVGEILLRDMMKDCRGFAVSGDNDIFHFAGLDDAHGFFL